MGRNKEELESKEVKEEEKVSELEEPCLEEEEEEEEERGEAAPGGRERGERGRIRGRSIGVAGERGGRAGGG